MRLSKLFIALIVVALLAAGTLAVTEWNERSSGTEKEMASSNYKMHGDVGVRGMAGPTESSTRKTILGFLAGLFGGDGTPPTIANFKIGGKLVGEDVREGDFIAYDAELTATVTDNVGINRGLSMVGAKELPGGTDHAVTFDQATYDPGNGSLSYTLDNLPDGEYEIRIDAVDTTGNSTDVAVTVNVESTLRAINPLVFPNPYNPDAGNLRVGYLLTRKPTGSIVHYVFNSFNQLVYKRHINAPNIGARAGYETIYWNGVNNFGEKVSPGIYFWKITSDNKLLATIKVAVLR